MAAVFSAVSRGVVSFRRILCSARLGHGHCPGTLSGVERPHLHVPVPGAEVPKFPCPELWKELQDLRSLVLARRILFGSHVQLVGLSEESLDSGAESHFVTLFVIPLAFNWPAWLCGFFLVSFGDVAGSLELGSVGRIGSAPHCRAWLRGGADEGHFWQRSPEIRSQLDSATRVEGDTVCLCECQECMWRLAPC